MFKRKIGIPPPVLTGSGSAGRARYAPLSLLGRLPVGLLTFKVCIVIESRRIIKFGKIIPCAHKKTFWHLPLFSPS